MGDVRVRAGWKCFLCSVLLLASGAGWAQGGTLGRTTEKIIIDTDIGDDVDDAFALALAVKSPELEILGVSTTFGDTEARAKIVDRLLGEVGRADIPVLAGKATATENPMSQRKYGGGGHFARIRTAMRWSFCWSRFGSIRARLRWLRLGR